MDVATINSNHQHISLLLADVTQAELGKTSLNLNGTTNSKPNMELVDNMFGQKWKSMLRLTCVKIGWYLSIKSWNVRIICLELNTNPHSNVIWHEMVGTLIMGP